MVFAFVMNLVIADAVVKELAVGILKDKASCALVPNFLDLAYVENRGCAWGMFQGAVWPLAVFALVALAFVLWKRKTIFGEKRVGLIAEILLYAGIIGNLIDRLVRGYVIDMFDFHYYASHFPCFNLADSYICIAAGLLVLCSSEKRTC